MPRERTISGRLAPAWARLAPWVAPAALAAVALQQIHLARSELLCPWKGGGFGMFATTDRSGVRDVRAFALGEGAATRLAIPDELANQRLRARDLPSQQHLVELATGILAVGRGVDAAHSALRVEVGLTELDLERGAPRRRVLREVVVGRPP
jgi:hypothetical protein